MTLGITFSAGGRVPADSLQRMVDKIDQHSAGVGASASRTAALSIANSSQTDLTLNTEINDPRGFFAPTSAVFTVPAGLGGLYAINAHVQWDVNATGWRRLGISKNNGTTVGTDIWHTLQTTPGAGADCGQIMSIDWLPLAVGDTVRAKVWHTAGVALNVVTARMTVRRVAE